MIIIPKTHVNLDFQKAFELRFTEDIKTTKLDRPA